MNRPTKGCDRGRILVLDDDPSIRRTLKRELDKRHDTVAVASVRAANAALRAGKFDLLVLDIRLGDGEPDGIEFLGSLPPGRHGGTVCMLTGYLDHGLIHDALLAGADDYLVKGDSSIITGELDRLVEIGRMRPEDRPRYRDIADPGLLRSLRLRPGQIDILVEMVDRDFPSDSELAAGLGLEARALYERLRRLRARCGAKTGGQLTRFLTVLDGYVSRSRVSWGASADTLPRIQPARPEVELAAKGGR